MCNFSCALAQNAQVYIPEVVDLIGKSRYWKKLEGVDAKSVLNIDIAPSGTLWFALQNGAQSYDGLHFTTYGPEDGLSGNNVKIIKETQAGEVYAIDSTGIFIFTEKRWQRIFEMKSDLAISKAIEAPDGSVWFVDHKSVIRIKGSNAHRFPLIGSKLQDLTLDNEGRLWTVEANGSVLRCDISGDSIAIDHVWQEVAEGPLNTYVGPPQIECTSDGRIWLISPSYNNGPLYFNEEKDAWVATDLKPLATSPRNYSLLEYEPGSILLSGEESLLKRENGKWLTYDKHDLNLTPERTILRSGPQGNIWLWVSDLGLFRIDRKGNRRKTYNGLNFQCDWQNRIRCFISEKGDIVFHDLTTNTWTTHSPDHSLIDKAVAAIVDSNGIFWAVGSHKNTAAASSFEKGEWIRHLFPELGSKVGQKAVIETSDGSILFGAGRFLNPIENQGGLVRLYKTDTGYRRSAIMTRPRRPYKIGETARGTFVFGGRNVFETDGSGSKKVPMPKAYEPAWVDDFEIELNDDIWVANWGRGIVNRKANKWRTFQEDDGLSSNYVSRLLLLSDNNLLALTSEGLDRFDGSHWSSTGIFADRSMKDRADLKQSTDGAIWINLSSRSWLYRRLEWDPVEEPYQTTIYTPDKLPPTTNILAHISSNKYSRLLQVEFSGQDYWSDTPSSKLQYSYRINGSEWSQYSLETTKYFADLEPGTYKIEARARDLDGNIDPSPAHLTATIQIPFWQTPLFLYLTILGIVITIALAIALVLQRLRHVIELDRVRLRFLTNISHELRSPLALIMWPLEKILKDEELPSSHMGISMAIRNTKRLNQLVEQLLDYRKAGAGLLKMNPKNADFVQCLNITLNDFKNLANSRGQSIEFQSDVSKYNTLFDEDIFRKIIDNLILNALKYSKDNTTISVSLITGSITSTPKGSIRITIEDQGVGIDKDTLCNIFEPFYTGDKKINKRMRSYGVGLALVKELVDLWNGEISIDSPTSIIDGVGIGSRFTVELPNLPPTGELTLQAGASSTIDAQSPTVPESNLPPTVIEHSDRSASDPLLLIVDDQAELREYLAHELADEYKIVQAQNGKEGLEIATELIPDMIISDIVMPEMDGVKFSEAIKANPSTSHIPVILQTSLASAETESESLESGAVDYIKKPFSISSLKRKVHNHLEIRKQFSKRLNELIFASTEKEERSSEEIDPEVQFVNTVRQLLQENWDRFEFNAEAMAKELGVSRSSLYQKFKTISNTTPAEVIKSFRLDKAAELIKSGEPIAEVSDRIGYADTSAFYRAFKKRFDCSPAVYRKQS